MGSPTKGTVPSPTPFYVIKNGLNCCVSSILHFAGYWKLGNVWNIKVTTAREILVQPPPRFDPYLVTSVHHKD